MLESNLSFLETPFKIAEFCHLSQLGVGQQNFKFGITSFDSDQYVTINEITAGECKPIIVELSQNFNIRRELPDNQLALRHSTKNIIALRACNQQNGNNYLLQIFDAYKQEQMKIVELSEKIVYWKWCNNTVLAVVTTKSVYHIDIYSDEQYTKILDRSGDLLERESLQIIDYNLENNEKWCALVGISTLVGSETINGHIQLFMVGEAKQQLLQGHCCVFGEVFIHDDQQKSTLFCYVERRSGEVDSTLHIIEIGAHPANFQKINVTNRIKPALTQDFPRLMYICKKFGLLFIISKFSFLTVYELSTAILIYERKQKISDQSIFAGTENTQNGNYFVINQVGVIYSIMIDEKKLIDFILDECELIPNILQTVFKMACIYKLNWENEMYVEKFDKYLQEGNIINASMIAAISPNTLLRNSLTISKFKSLNQLLSNESFFSKYKLLIQQQILEGSQPLVIYFQTLLDRGKLNMIESIELCILILQQGTTFVETLIFQDKLFLSEQLGDILEPYNKKLAELVYQKTNTKQKCIQLDPQTEQINLEPQTQLITEVTDDPLGIIKNIMIQLEQSLTNTNSLSQMNLTQESQINGILEMTSFFVQCLKTNKPEYGLMQTKVLEINFLKNPQVADSILQQKIWTQFDCQRIAHLCEEKELYQRALEYYQNDEDIKRVILNHTKSIDYDFLVNYFIKFDELLALQFIEDLLSHNISNLQIVVNLASQNIQRLSIPACVKIFEALQSNEGVYLFLRSLIDTTNDQLTIHIYIEATYKCNQIVELLRVINEKQDHYDPRYIKEFLELQLMPDPKPLMTLCNIHGYNEELIRYLHHNNQFQYIEVFIQGFNPQAILLVLDTLINLQCDENQIQLIILKFKDLCPIQQTINIFREKNKLKILENWLESLDMIKASEGNQTIMIHNALAEIKIDSQNDAEGFLQNNKYYVPKVIGKYCENRYPLLAVLAYKNGLCDDEMITLTKKNKMYKIQAEYLVERQSQELWFTIIEILKEDELHKEQFINYIVQVLQELNKVEKIEFVIQAFVKFNLPLILIELLQKIINNAQLGDSKNYQNLLISTAIKFQKNKVMSLINQFNDFDGPEIAKLALIDDNKMFEEALAIYKKLNLNAEALDVLLIQINNLQRARLFAEDVNQTQIWSRLAKFLLDADQTAEAIQSFIRANDYSQFQLVIKKMELQENWEALIEYLLKCRENLKNTDIDNSLAFAYAKLLRYEELKALVWGINNIDFQTVGNKMQTTKFTEGAKILLEFIQQTPLFQSDREFKFQEAEDKLRESQIKQKEQESKLCIICYDRKRTYVALPCCHYVYCDKCQELVMEKGECFYCYKQVTEMKKVFE